MLTLLLSLRQLSVITLKRPSGAVTRSYSFLLLLFDGIWDVHWLTFLNFCI